MKQLISYLLLLIAPNFLISGCIANTSDVPDEKSEISAEKIVKKIASNENVYYVNKVISDELDFTSIQAENDESKGALRSYVSSSITFIDCIFEGKVIAFRKDDKNKSHFVSFEKNLTFINSEFKDEVNFKETTVKGIVNFSGSTFNKKANFEGAFFSYKNVYFSEATFKDELRCQRVVFEGNVSFFKSVFEGVASFQNALFKGNAQFGAAKFFEYTDFGSVTVNSGFFFNYADFLKKAIFSNSYFRGRTEFIQSKFNHISEFKKVVFGGKTKFTNSTFNGTINFEGSVFLLGKPMTDGIIKKEGSEIILKNTFYSEQKNITLDDFLTY